MTSFVNKIMIGSSVFALTQLCMVQTSFAQDVAGGGQDASSRALDSITITAQRRESDVQTTAAAVTALSGDDLNDRSIRNIEDLGLLNPSLQITNNQGEANIYIRGIGFTSIIAGLDPSTAFHMDGVYVARPAAQVSNFFDVERVEILKGPQGTLYGRNATSGSINVITKRPTNEFSAEFSALAGNYDRLQAFGAISGPISDRVRGRLAVQKETRGGYSEVVRQDIEPRIDQPLITDDVEDLNALSIRGTVEVDWSDTVRSTVIADYYEQDDQAVVWHFGGENPDFTQVALFNTLANDAGRQTPNTRTIPSEQDSFNRVENWGVSHRLDADLPAGYSLMALTAYRETKPNVFNDLDMSNAFLVDASRRENQQQFSQELQLSSPTDQFVSFILGAYYFDEKNDIFNEYNMPYLDQVFGTTPDYCCTFRLNGLDTETTAYAIFGEATIDLTSTLSAVVGGRYSHEKRSGANVGVFEEINFGLAEFAVDEDSWSAFTPKFGINYQVTDDLFSYLSVSKGFKSGGFNWGAFLSFPPDVTADEVQTALTFDQEEVWAYEVGAKSDLLDGRLRVNAAAFYYDYQDLQVPFTEENNVVIRNAATSKIMGAEIETQWLLTDSLRGEFNYTYLNAEYDDYTTIDAKRPGLGEQDLSGNKLLKAPEHQFNVGLEYTGLLPERLGELTLRGDWIYQSEIFFTEFNRDEQSQDGYHWLKARATYAPVNSSWSIAAFVDNITDELVLTNQRISGNIIGSVNLNAYAPPRTYGLQISYKY